MAKISMFYFAENLISNSGDKKVTVLEPDVMNETKEEYLG